MEAGEREGDAMEVLMCPPSYFTVRYRINPWMRPETPTDAALAMAQWQALRTTYLDLGFTVHLIEALPGFPDMVYAANGATIIGEAAYSANFRHPQRAGEAPAYLARLTELGFTPAPARAVNEGQGDLLTVNGALFAGHGFRTTLAAHEELRELTGARVLSLELIDPRYYHLDTALAVLTGDLIAYHPPAFSPASRALLEAEFPDAIIATAATAGVLGLNCVSDGRHVVLPPRASGFAAQLRRRGFTPIAVDLSELLKGGGGAKCCTLILRKEETWTR